VEQLKVLHKAGRVFLEQEWMLLAVVEMDDDGMGRDDKAIQMPIVWVMAEVVVFGRLQEKHHPHKD